MFEQVKSILINQYNVELERFEELRKKIEELEAWGKLKRRIVFIWHFSRQ